MALKFGRNYTLYAQAVDDSIIQISLPFTLNFSITRNILSSANTASFTIINLASATRNLLRKDANDFNTFRSLSLFAGYGANNLPVCFNGTVKTGYSVRSHVDYETTLEGYDGGFSAVNGSINMPFSAGTPIKAAITQIATLGLPRVQLGKIGNYTGVLPRGNSYSGNTMDVLNDLSGNGAFIDNNKINILKDNEALLGSLPNITSESGLLGTPRLEESYISLDIIFEPRLQIGQTVRVASTTAAEVNKVNQIAFNGPHKVVGISHKGTISDAICGDVITTVTLVANSALVTVP